MVDFKDIKKELDTINQRLIRIEKEVLSLREKKHEMFNHIHRMDLKLSDCIDKEFLKREVIPLINKFDDTLKVILEKCNNG